MGGGGGVGSKLIGVLEEGSERARPRSECVMHASKRSRGGKKRKRSNE